MRPMHACLKSSLPTMGMSSPIPTHSNSQTKVNDVAISSIAIPLHPIRKGLASGIMNWFEPSFPNTPISIPILKNRSISWWVISTPTHVKSWTISLQLICSAFLNHPDYWRFLRWRLFHPTRFISLPNSSSSDKWIASDTFLSTPTKRNWPLQFSTPRSLFLFSVSIGFRFQELIHNIALHSTKNHPFRACFSHFLSQVFKAAYSIRISLL